jgi:hypothetical protein
MDPFYLQDQKWHETPYKPSARPRTRTHNWVVKNINAAGANPATLLLALYTMASMGQRAAYLPSYMPRRINRNNPIDYTDIGIWAAVPDGSGEAIGLPVDTHAADFTEESYRHYVGEVFQPDLFSITLDLPFAGPRSYILSLLRRCAFGMPIENPKADGYGNISYHARFDKAKSEFIAVMDSITGDKFSPILGNAPLFNWVTEVPTGYYVDSDGVRQDIDNVMNATAVANWDYAVNRSFKRLKNYDEMLLDDTTNVDLRLAAFRGLAEEITNHTVVWTGRSHRVTLSNELLIAVSTVVNGSGLSAVTSSPYFGNNFDTHRVQASFLNRMPLLNAERFFQGNTGQGYSNPYQQYHNHGYGR